MSDPGSIVGAISLLLQIVQGLKKYYLDYRDFSKHVSNIITNIERAEAILSALKTPVEHFWREDEELPIEVRKCVKSCEEACGKLGNQLRLFKKCHGQQNTVLPKARMLYPFRKSTLEDLQKQLNRLFNDLQLLMNALNLDSAIKFHHQAVSHASATHNEIRRINDRQIYQTELLEEILQQYERWNQQIDTLTLDVINLLKAPPRRLPTSSALKPACDQYVGIVHATKNHNLQSTSKEICCAPISCCSCSDPFKRNRLTSSKRWGCFAWSKQSTHPIPCPLSTVAHQTRTALARLRFCYHGLGYLIDASLTWSRSSLSPYLAFRCIVPRNSPLFTVVDAYSTLILEPRADDTGSSVLLQRNIEATLLTMRALHSLIDDGRGSVRDVDLEGNTLAHALLHSLGSAVQREPHSIHFLEFSEVLLYSIRLLQDLGCDVNEENNLGCTPVGSLVIGSTAPIPPSISEMRSMIDNLPWTTVFGSFELSTDFLTRQYRNFYHRESGESMIWTEVYSQLKTDHESGPYCLDGPLTRAVTIQNEEQVRRILQAPQSVVRRENKDFSIWRALTWPRGFELILPLGFMDKEEYPEILKAAVHCNYTAVVDALLRSSQFDHNMWPVAVDSGDIHFMKLIVSTLYNNYCESSATILLIPGNPIGPDPEYCARLYMPTWTARHGSLNMTVEAAHILHEAGFAYADISNTEQGTPFWYLAATSTLPLYEYLQLMVWLSSQGADVTATHPTWGTMPLNHISRIIVLRSLQNEDAFSPLGLPDSSTCSSSIGTNGSLMAKRLNGFVPRIFEYNQRDHCRCLCAPMGCDVVITSLKTIQHCNRSEPLSPTEQLKKVWKVLTICLSPERFLETSVCDAIIRVSTFDIMQLSHTCYCHDLDPLSTERMSDEDINDIRYAEKCDIDTFEMLLVELEGTWSRFEGTIMDFMNGPWAMRMTAFLEERNILMSKKEVEYMREIGVRVHTCELPNSGASQHSFDLVWLQEKIDKILHATSN